MLFYGKEENTQKKNKWKHNKKEDAGSPKRNQEEEIDTCGS